VFFGTIIELWKTCEQIGRVFVLSGYIGFGNVVFRFYQTASGRQSLSSFWDIFLNLLNFKKLCFVMDAGGFLYRLVCMYLGFLSVLY
jgi:hypothetical protein